MKNRIMKITAVVLGVALIMAGVGNSAYALTGDKDKDKEAVKEAVSELICDEESDKPEKDETVYVIAGNDGTVKKIIVSDWLKNMTGETFLSDETGLTDIEEVKGEDHVYAMNGENSRVWDAEGNDIYYRGSIEKELPVALKVSYYLDGQEITAEDLKGKSGELTIRYEYENKQYEMKTINGREEKIYVPFAMLTGMILDNDVFTDVEVSNGKLVNDGNRTVVIGAALPGLRENLGLEEDKMPEIADRFEIKAHVENYEPAMAVTLATNDLFNKINTDKLDTFDGLTSSMDELTDAANQLMNGSSQLYEGLETLLEKAGVLANGIDALAEGSAQLKEGAEQLDAGIGQVKDGLTDLNDGLDTLVKNNDALNSGAKQVFETLLATAQSQLTAAGVDVPELTIDNYSQVLEGVIATLDEDAVYAKAQETVRAAVEEKRGFIEGQVTEAVRAQVTEAVNAAVKAQVEEGVKEAVRAKVEEGVRNEVKALAAANTVQQMSSDEVAVIISKNTDAKMAEDDIVSMIEQTVNAKLASEEIVTLTESTIEAKMSSDEIKETIKTNTDLQVEKAIADNLASDEVKAKLAQASEGASKIIALKTSLDSYNTFYKGLAAYTNGVSQAAAGAAQLKEGSVQLKDGSAALANGSTALNAGLTTVQGNMPALIDGVTQLRDGAGRLSDGMKEFNEKGIEKLVEAVDGDLEGLVERFKAVTEVSKNYKSFSGLSDEMDGEVKFIYKIGE
ncbi:MAG: hypothetical protein J5824_02525 [Lachnospiraceae bacterium]|nr:hypothetical protein [Lachnospiraceae bacterium]